MKPSHQPMKITSNHTIGIIGGSGKTGGQFAKLFEDQGFSVRVTGSKNKDENALIIKECDIVIFAVPLAASIDIIEKEIQNATKENQLILDLSSLKEKQVGAMLKAKGEVIGMHPLFAPTTDPMNQTIILCPGRCEDETLNSLESTLHTMGLRTIIEEASEHDRLMALLQVLPHVKSLLMADVLQKIGGDVIDTIDKTATPAYRIELNLVGRFLDDSADLYGPIILDNPETINMLTMLHKSLGEVIQMAGNKELDTFRKKYESLKSFFRHHTKDGRDKTEACIRTLTKMKQKS